MEQLLPFPQSSRVQRHEGQEGQLQLSALSLCLTGAREFHSVIPASSPCLLSEHHIQVPSGDVSGFEIILVACRIVCQGFAFSYSLFGLSCLL